MEQVVMYVYSNINVKQIIQNRSKLEQQIAPKPTKHIAQNNNTNNNDSNNSSNGSSNNISNSNSSNSNSQDSQDTQDRIAALKLK